MDVKASEIRKVAKDAFWEICVLQIGVCHAIPVNNLVQSAGSERDSFIHITCLQPFILLVKHPRTA
jgi:hypothetical protein